jgi:hypothetical protein
MLSLQLLITATLASPMKVFSPALVAALTLGSTIPIDSFKHSPVTFSPVTRCIRGTKSCVTVTQSQCLAASKSPLEDEQPKCAAPINNLHTELDEDNMQVTGAQPISKHECNRLAQRSDMALDNMATVLEACNTYTAVLVFTTLNDLKRKLRNARSDFDMAFVGTVV